MSLTIESLISKSGKKISGPLVLKPKIFRDDRGFFMESWNQEQFNKVVDDKTNFVQDNHSKSQYGVLRGMHYQLPKKEQGKLVRCVSGEIFDVAIDIRKKSNSFGQWVGIRLDSVNHNQLWIPKGFAHGFLVLSDSAEVMYKTTDFWSSEHEMSIRWDDPSINIDWPKISLNPILSTKDSQASFLEEISSSHLF